MQTEQLVEKEPITSQEEQVIGLYLKDLNKLEALIIPQIEELDSKIPEIYNGYTEAVKTVTRTALDYIDNRTSTARYIAVFGQGLARGLNAYGKYQAAKRHNEMLERFLVVKREIAQHNLELNAKAREHAAQTLNSVKRLFVKTAGADITELTHDAELTKKKADIALRVLNLYRTNLMLMMVSDYLAAEYECWLKGEQTSGIERPDLYTANVAIINELFNGEEGFDVIERIADSTGFSTGAELMLISDYELAMTALRGNICNITIEKASPVVAQLMSNNRAYSDFQDATSPIISHVGTTPDGGILTLGIVAVLAIIAACIWCIPGEWWVRVLIAISGTVAVARIADSRSDKARAAHVRAGSELMNNVDMEVGTKCGQVNNPEIDYEYHDTTKAAIQGFFNS